LGPPRPCMLLEGPLGLVCLGMWGPCVWAPTEIGSIRSGITRGVHRPADAAGPVGADVAAMAAGDALRALEKRLLRAAHADVWREIWARLDRLHSVTWLKAHLDEAEGAARGLDEGDRRMNEAAARAAGRAAAGHTEDPGALVAWRCGCMRVEQQQRDPLSVYKRCRAARLVSEPAVGYTIRFRPKRAEPNRGMLAAERRADRHTLCEKNGF